MRTPKLVWNVRSVMQGGLAFALAIVGLVALATPSFAHNNLMTAVNDSSPVAGTTPDASGATSTTASNGVASISLVETADFTTVSAAGQVVTYSLAIGNTGTAALDNVEVTDALALPATESGLGPITCATGTNGSIALAPQAIDTCTATYTVTQADLSHGSVAGTATVVGSSPESNTPVTDSSSLSLPVTSVSVVNSASPSSAVTAGSTVPILYTMTVTNNGTATTTAPIVVTDSAPDGTTLIGDSPACVDGGTPSCRGTVNGSTITWTIPAGVAPGASYTLTYAVTANPTDRTGTITNTASWSGPSCGAPEPVVVTAPTVTTCPTNTVASPVTAAPVTGAAVALNTPTTPITPITSTPATSPPPTSPITAAAPAATTASALAFTGALLSWEWAVGLAALALGATMTAIARSRRRNAKGATT